MFSNCIIEAYRNMGCFDKCKIDAIVKKMTPQRKAH